MTNSRSSFNPRRGISWLLTAPGLLGATLSGQADARATSLDVRSKQALKLVGFPADAPGSGITLAPATAPAAAAAPGPALLPPSTSVGKRPVVAPAPAPMHHAHPPLGPISIGEGINQNVTGFVKANGTRFVVEDEPFAFGGTNDFSAALVHLYTDDQVDAMMQAHAEKGARVVRIFAFSNGDGAGSVPTPQPIQPQVGRFDEVALQRLDLVIASAAKHGIRIIMPMVNFEPALGGMQWYVDNILGAGQDKELFYTDPQLRAAYKNYVSLLVNRINTVTGIPYKEDPAIMAWELSNEIHTSNQYEEMRKIAPGTLANGWLSEMSTFIKGLGISQMVSTGEEGYRADGDSSCCYNTWINGGYKGVDFVANTQLPNIDFATIHYYPDNWNISVADYANYSSYFLSDRAGVAHNANKPIILEESGLGGLNGFVDFDRDDFLNTIYGMARDEGFRGEMVWEAWPEGTQNLGAGYDFTYDQSGGQAVKKMYQDMVDSQDA